MKDNDQHAFPTMFDPSGATIMDNGMTLRDYFAAKAMQKDSPLINIATTGRKLQKPFTSGPTPCLRACQMSALVDLSRSSHST